MKIIKELLKFLNYEKRFYWLDSHGLLKILSDKQYIRYAFKARINKKLNLKNPKTFNEKLQWLKLYNRIPRYTTMVDKYAVKKYVANLIGEEHIIPTIGVWDRVEDIDFESLPNQFVLKCTHDSGGVIICRDKDSFNFDLAKSKLEKSLKRDFYNCGREWPYKDVPRKVIAEQYMEDNSKDLVDYKIHNFNGVPKIILICRDRYKKSGLTEDFYSDTWEHFDVKRPGHPNSSGIECPKELEKMLELSKVLSKDIPFVRTDFYTINHKIYFGELTFFPASGFEKFVPEEYDELFGSWIELPVMKGRS